MDSSIASKRRKMRTPLTKRRMQPFEKSNEDEKNPMSDDGSRSGCMHVMLGTGDDVPENVDLELGVTDTIQRSFESLLQSLITEHNFNNPNSPSIYKAPSTLRDLSPASFNPRVVSIGPLHRDDANVQAFECQKVTYLHSLLDRVKPSQPEEPLKACVQKVASSVDRIKACYAGMIETYDNIGLTNMMVKDACFILEFINQISDQSISGNMLLAQSIIYDLVLLENQIPFFVLNDVFQCTMHHLEPKTYLTEFIRPALKFLNPFFQTKLRLRTIRTDKHDHILGVLHKCYQPGYKKNILSDLSSSTIRSAVELDRAGVSFKPNRKAKWPMEMDVKLHVVPCCCWSWCKTTFRMPALRFNHFTELVLRNLIAYEQSSSSLVPHYITSYALALDMLIDTQDDIARLVKSKVLVNHIGSHEEAANMINSLCKEVAWVDFFYAEQWEELDRHCNHFWPRNIARLRSTYFSNPWSIIALVAGIVLFALTVVQTYFTIKST